MQRDLGSLWYRPYGKKQPTRRVTFDLAVGDHLALRRASVEEETPMADVLRTLVALWRTDGALHERVTKVLEGDEQLAAPATG